MTSSSKIKRDRTFYGIIPALVSLVVLALVSVFYGIFIGFKVLGAIIFIYTIFVGYAWYRTRNTGNLISTIYMLLFSALLFSMPMEEQGTKMELSNLSKTLLILLYVFLIVLIYILLTRRAKWWGREILELAAMNVEENTGSFTERPMPAGRIEASPAKLNGFARFFERNLLGLTYRRDKKLIFLPLKFRNEFFALYSLNYNYMAKTWVAVDEDGKVSVNISREDYLDYKDDLDFDKLCQSMGLLFSEFYQLYEDGLGVRIIDRLRAAGVSLFT